MAQMTRELSELTNAIEKMRNEHANENAKKDKLKRDADEL